jgi:hypothetical protein
MEGKRDNHGAENPLFGASVNVLVRWLLASVAAAGTVAVVVWYSGYRSSWWQGQGRAPDQPVLFSHHHHVSELKIDCRYCHGSVEKGAFAGMPSTETCMSCHSGVFTDSPMLRPVLASLSEKRPLQWTKVNDLPGYVYFNHGIHVSKGIACTSCHGDIGDQALSRKAQPLTMSWCLDCHREPEKSVGRLEDVFAPSRKFVPDLSAEEKIMLCHRFGIESQHLTDCVTCHR